MQELSMTKRRNRSKCDRSVKFCQQLSSVVYFTSESGPNQNRSSESRKLTRNIMLKLACVIPCQMSQFHKVWNLTISENSENCTICSKAYGQQESQISLFYLFPIPRYGSFSDMGVGVNYDLYFARRRFCHVWVAISLSFIIIIAWNFVHAI